MAGERNLPGLGLKGFFTPSSDGYGSGANTDLLMLSIVGRLTVKSRVSSLPADAVNGDIYLLTTGGNANKIAARDNASWFYVTPIEGWFAYVADEARRYVYLGTAWAPTYSKADIDTMLGSMTSEAPILHVRDEKTPGTYGGNSALDWADRDLNTIVRNEIPGALLASNHVTLPAGTYEVDIDVPMVGAAGTRSRLYSVSDSAVLLYGTSAFGTTSPSQLHNSITSTKGKIVLTGTKILSVQMLSSVSAPTYGCGAPASSGLSEVYTQVIFKKVP